MRELAKEQPGYIARVYASIPKSIREHTPGAPTEFDPPLSTGLPKPPQVKRGAARRAALEAQEKMPWDM